MSSDVDNRRPVIVEANLLQTLLRRAFSMMPLLIGNVIENPTKLLLAEADHAKTSLPLDCLVPRLLIHLIGTRALEFPEQVADTNRRFNVHRQVDVRARTVDAVEIDALRLSATVDEKTVHQRFKSGSQQRLIPFGVPVDVQLDLMEDVARHDYPLSCGSPAKAGCQKLYAGIRTTS